jgi:hypothetical protein
MIKEAQLILAINEKTKRYKTDWYLSYESTGKKEKVKPDYWS